MSAGAGVPPEAGWPWVTAGSAGHCPGCVCAMVALVPAFSVSQPSPGQVTLEIVCTTRLPTDPAPASLHSVGVAGADTSLQRRPAMPTTTTGGSAAVPPAFAGGVAPLAGEFWICTVPEDPWLAAAGVAGATAAPVAAAATAATATPLIATRGSSARNLFTRITVSGLRPPPGAAAPRAPWAATRTARPTGPAGRCSSRTGWTAPA